MIKREGLRNYIVREQRGREEKERRREEGGREGGSVL